MITCGSCGRQNADDAVFCQWCNHFLAWTPSDEGDLAVAGPSGADTAPAAGPGTDGAGPAEPSAQDPGGEEAGATAPAGRTAQPPSDAPPDGSPAAGPEEAPVPSQSQPPPTVEGALAVLAEGRRLAASQERPDLARRLDEAEDRLTRQSVPVVVVGEFKRGKSTLVNALLQRAVCPVDADIVTTVPTLVRWAERPTALVHTGGPGEPSAGEPADPARLTELVTGHDDAGPSEVRSVEVGLPHPLLRSGLCLVDTPGVGGLDSAHGLLTLGALDAAKASLFVTDASQELTAPELAFLRAVVAKGTGPVCVVMTKTDIHADWRRVRDLDEQHLRDAGLAVPVLAVSSFLRLRAARDPELEQESGFSRLLEFLERDVLVQGTAEAAKTAAQDVAFVAHQLGRPLDAAAAVLTEPEKAEQVVSTLAETRKRTARLTAPTATWQQTLADGIADLTANVDHDLQQRARAILAQAEVVIKGGDPKDTWNDITLWLQRQVVTAAVENRALLAGRAQRLAEEVGERFELEAAFDAGAVAGPPRAESVTTVTPSGAESLVVPGGQLGPLVVAGRTAMLVPLTLYSLSTIVSTSALLVIAPLGIALGAGIGHRLIVNERKRQLAHRQQLAAAATRKYLDEAMFIVSKETQDALRLTSRELRDGFQRQALEIHRSSVRALSVVEQARSSSPERSEEVIAGSRAVHRLSAVAGRLADAPVVAVARG